MLFSLDNAETMPPEEAGAEICIRHHDSLLKGLGYFW